MTCTHGHIPPHCTITGCESSRPATALIDWTAADAEPRKPAGWENEQHTREARELAEQVDRLAKRDNASGDMTKGRGFIGVREDGTRAPGALPWWWCYGRQPVHVKGAVYAESHEGAHLIRDIGEREAERAQLAMATLRDREECRGLSDLAIAERFGLTASQLRRRRRGRRAA